MNYFVEGLQGSGKSTLVSKLASRYTDYSVFREGDYSPVELAWCAYIDLNEYDVILDRYKSIRSMIEDKSHVEEDHVIVCYTQVITDIPDFHKNLERYEIYNGRRSFDEFKEIIFRRFNSWAGDKMIFECSLFQNIVEDMILYRIASDEEILKFYKELADILRDKDFRVMYLETENIADSIEVIRKERSDGSGNEMWFPLMCRYFDESPYAKSKGISGEKELLKHFQHRQELELRICREIFYDKVSVIKSKEYNYRDLFLYIDLDLLKFDMRELNKIKREDDKDKIVDELVEVLCKNLELMEHGAVTSISDMIKEIYMERGYSFVRVNYGVGYVWTKDGGKTYSIKDYDQMQILEKVIQKVKDTYRLDFSKYAGLYVGLPYRIDFTLRKLDYKLILTDEEKAALEEKMDNPDAVVMCPRCGGKLIYEKRGNSVAVECEKENCIYTAIRGL